MKKSLCVLLNAVLVFSFAFAMVGCGSESSATGFDLEVTTFNFGPQVDKVIIHADADIDADSVSADTFSVATDNSLEGAEIENGDLAIDEVSADGSDITIDLKNGPDQALAAVLYWNDPEFANQEIALNYVITQNEAVKTADGEELTFDALEQNEVINPEVAAFTEGTSENGLAYRDFQPTEQSADGTHPLVVWLHGGGEGGNLGQNNVTQLSANRGALTFATEENQTKMDYPYVLAPQSPSHWLVEFPYGDLTIKGEDSTDDIVALVEEYIAAHKDIDADRILVVGASMGGYQTWATVAAKPELFKAMIACCTANAVDDKIIDAVKDKAIFIAHDKDDYVVPVDYSKDAYNKLQELGADATFVELEKIEIDGNECDFHDGVYQLMAVNGIEDANGLHVLDWAAQQLTK